MRRPEQSPPSRLRRASQVFAFASACGAISVLAALSLPSCLKRGYPLAQSGQADVRMDVAGALFATDTLDEKGNPIGARQQPYKTGVTLFLSEGGAPAYGAFVTVRVEPRQALVLQPDPDENTDFTTCGEIDGTFRCTASPEGLARFIATSQSDWSGTASILVSWADQTKEEQIEILPAGLPDKATNFTMLIGGLDQTLENSRVLPTYLALTCAKEAPSPKDLGSKWRPGQIRSREAYVRATAPANAPSVVENAPVIIESLSGEAALSLSAACDEADRKSRLRVLLGPTGESERFFLCFSDIGGAAEFAVTSGQKQLDPGPKIIVDPEPRLLSVRTLQSVVEVGPELDLFEINAYDVNLVRIEMPVDLSIEPDNQVLTLEKASVTLDKEPEPSTVIAGTPKAEGVVNLHVRPRLFKNPDCISDPISVIP